MKILLLILTITPAWAVDYTLDKASNKARPHYVGEVRQFRGKAFRLSEGKRKQIADGMQFYKSDLLQTEEKSIVRLQLVDDTVMTVGPNSEIKFEEFDFKSKSERRIHSFIRGQIAGQVKHKAAPGDIQIRTDNAIMGVRGTRFLANHRKVNGLEISEFALLSGSVVVTDDKNKQFELKQSDKIVLVRDPQKEELGQEQRKLSAEELQFLEAEDKNFGADFRPFLPFFDPSNISEDSALFVYLAPRPKGVSPVETPAKQSAEGSFENLRKLNDQLKNKRK